MHFKILSIVYSSFLFVNGNVPHTNVYNITPNAHISTDDLISYAYPLIISGAI